MRMKRGFYGLCSHIDIQLAVVIGMLREVGRLQNTAIIFTSDHGDMLGDHGQVFKCMMYEQSANIPMIVIPPHGDERLRDHAVDDRLCTLADVMPTILDFAGLPIPGTCEGHSLLGSTKRT